MDPINYNAIKNNEILLNNIIERINKLEEDNANNLLKLNNMQKYLTDRLEDKKIVPFQPIIPSNGSVIVGSEEQPIHVVGFVFYNEVNGFYGPPVVKITDAKTNEVLLDGNGIVSNETKYLVTSEMAGIFSSRYADYFYEPQDSILGKNLYPNTKSIKIENIGVTPMNTEYSQAGIDNWKGIFILYYYL